MDLVVQIVKFVIIKMILVSIHNNVNLKSLMQIYCIKEINISVVCDVKRGFPSPIQIGTVLQTA